MGESNLGRFWGKGEDCCGVEEGGVEVAWGGTGGGEVRGNLVWFELGRVGKSRRR